MLLPFYPPSSSFRLLGVISLRNSWAVPTLPPAPLSRAQRAHYRLTFQERLTRNTRVSTTGQVTVKLFGVPEGFAAWLGFAQEENIPETMDLNAGKRSMR